MGFLRWTCGGTTLPIGTKNSTLEKHLKMPKNLRKPEFVPSMGFVLRIGEDYKNMPECPDYTRKIAQMAKYPTRSNGVSRRWDRYQ